MKLEMKRVLGVLLTLAMVIGLLPEMNLTAYAGTDTYTALIANATVVKFNNYNWYIIEDNSTSATEGTVTLVAADESFGTSSFRADNSNNHYNESDVKAYLDHIVAGTAGEGKPNFKDVADAIKPVTLTTYADGSTTDVYEITESAKLYLLSEKEIRHIMLPSIMYTCNIFQELNFNGVENGGWWLRSAGYDGRYAACTYNEDGIIYSYGDDATMLYGVRPALQLNLESVTFSSETNEFSLKNSDALPTLYHNTGATDKWYRLAPGTEIADWFGVGSGDDITDSVWYGLGSDTETKAITYGSDKPVTVHGEVNLILSDDYTLEADAGIIVPTGSTLNIYGGNYSQSIRNNGTLKATGRDGGAAIGGSISQEGGTVNVYGGVTMAKGSDGAPGIGGGKDAASNGILSAGTGIGLWGGEDETSALYIRNGNGISLEQNLTQRHAYMKLSPYKVSRSNTVVVADNTETYTIPVQNEKAVEVQASISEGNAKVNEITDADIAAATGNGDGSKGSTDVSDVKKDTITIDLSGANQEVTSVELTATSIQKLADAVSSSNNVVDTVTIKMTNATVVLDTKTLETLSEQMKGSTLKLVVDDKSSENLNTAQRSSLNKFSSAKPFEAYFESDGTRIHDFQGGEVKVYLKFTPDPGTNTVYYHVYYIAEDGSLTRYPTTYENGELGCTVPHFSDYAIVYDTSVENESGKKDVPEQPPETAGTTVETPAAIQPKELTAYEKKLALNGEFRVSQPGSKLKVEWGTLEDADCYEVFVQYCGNKFKKKPTQVITSGNSIVIKKLNGKKLKLKKNYKVYVVAYKTTDGEKEKLAKTITAHVVGRKNVKFSNPKELKVTRHWLNKEVGKTYKIKAYVTLVNKSRKSLSDKHAPMFRYASSDKSVATVNKKGVITTKGTGTCIIYVYAKNGYAQKIDVTVK